MWPFKSWRSPGELIIDLESQDSDTRKKAFNELIEHEDRGTDQVVLSLLNSLQEGKTDLLLPLIDIIGRRGIEDGVETLGKYLKDENPEIKLAALRALNKIPSQKSLDLILPFLADEDFSVRRETRDAIVKIYGEKAMGALIRGVSETRNSPLYFEIVSLFEEMVFFDKLIENFQHPDEEVRKFQLNNLLKFHYPDFIPLYLEMIELGDRGIFEKVKTALMDYSPDELIPPFKDYLQDSPSKPFLDLIDEIIISRFPEVKEEILRMGSAISKTEIRIEFFDRVLKKLDTLSFQAAFNLIDDPSPHVRNLIADALIRLLQSVKFRLSDPMEQNKVFLKKELDKWVTLVCTRAQKETNQDILAPVAKVLLSLGNEKPSSLIPVLSKLLSQQFSLTIKNLAAMDSKTLESILAEAIKQDKNVALMLISGVAQNLSPDLIRIILKNLATLQKSDLQHFRRTLSSRNFAGKIPAFFDDPDPQVRASALELIGEMGGEGFINKIEEKCHDPAPEVRLKALQVLQTVRHPKVSQLLEEFCSDPASAVALQALQDLKKIVQEDRYSKILSRAVNSPAEEIRTYALKEIAKISQVKYLANFNSLPPQVRKLAGSALLKLDSTFVDHLIGELRSLDPESRLRAALIMENLQVGGKGKDALLAGMKDPSKKVRAAIVKTLGVLGDKTLMGNLIEFFNDPDERVRANAIEAISGIGDESAIKLLIPFLEDQNNRIRANAALALWHIGKVNIIPVISKMLTKGDSLMKASSLWVLGEIKSEIYISMIIPLLNDREEIVRLNALKAIMKIKPEILKPILPNLRKDPSKEIKRLVTDLSYKLI